MAVDQDRCGSVIPIPVGLLWQTSHRCTKPKNGQPIKHVIIKCYFLYTQLAPQLLVPEVYWTKTLQAMITFCYGRCVVWGSSHFCDLGIPVSVWPKLALDPTRPGSRRSSTSLIVKVHLKSSKTDQSWSGFDLYVGRSYNAVAAMLAYLSVRGIDNGNRCSGRALCRGLGQFCNRRIWIWQDIRVIHSGLGLPQQQLPTESEIPPFSRWGGGQVIHIHTTSGFHSRNWHSPHEQWQLEGTSVIDH